MTSDIRLGPLAPTRPATDTPPMSHPQTTHLQHAEHAYRQAADRAERLRNMRNLAILVALDAGLTHKQIAAATGLTRGRIGQLAQTRSTP